MSATDVALKALHDAEVALEQAKAAEVATVEVSTVATQDVHTLATTDVPELSAANLVSEQPVLPLSKFLHLGPTYLGPVFVNGG